MISTLDQRIVTLVVALLAPWSVRAGPPPGIAPDPETKAWFDKLRSREGWSCCEVSHCRPAAVVPNDDGRVLAYIDKESFGPTAPDAWLEIPLHELRTRGNRPGTLRGAIVCFADSRVICADLEGAT